MRVIIAAVGLFAIAAFAASVMPTFWTFAAALIFIGFATVTMLTTANAFVQTTTDAAVRGRVMALYMAVLMGGTPFGAPIVGGIANAWGPRWALAAAGVAAAAACIFALTWAVLARSLRVRVHPGYRWRLVLTHAGKPLPVSALVPEDFSEEIAYTSPISLPALSRQQSRPRQNSDATRV
jgi:MFS family permease